MYREITEQEVDKIYSELLDPVLETGGSKFPGMTYEDGVRAVIELLDDGTGTSVTDIIE